MKTGISTKIWLALKICVITSTWVLFADNAFGHAVTCATNPNSISGVISYDVNANNSYCEFCGIGQVRIVVTNPTHIDMDDFSVTHDFQASGLEYVPGSTVGGSDPNISGTQLTWTGAEIPALLLISGKNNHNNYNSVEIIFQVRSVAGSEENLVTADRNVAATANYQFCPAITDVSVTTPLIVFELPLREPDPTVTKLGRNFDANQDAGSYAGTVYGNTNDDVIWQIEIRNTGLAALQDLKFDDVMGNANFDINYACVSEGAASNLANADGIGPIAGCTNSGIDNNISDFIVTDPFGNMGTAADGSEIDVTAGGSTFIFLVGKITDSCVANTNNTVSNIEWGCEADPDTGDGGITQTSTSSSPGNAVTTLSSQVNNNGLQIQRQLTGINTAQPVGSRGLMTITIDNQTGGTVKNIKLRDVLPTQYVIDSTFTPTILMTPAFGNYIGMIDTISWINPQANTFPLINPPAASDPNDPLANIAPEFDLLSSGPANLPNTNQIHMMRHGDIAEITFRVVMVEPTFIDKAANIDVRVENTGDATDPVNSMSLNNKLFVTFEQFCDLGVTQQASSYPFDENFASDPEDIDIDVTGTELIFILTNDPTQPLPLQISLTNNGGHYADDYISYITFGTTMEVITAPGSCNVTANPPLLEVWDIPADLPLTATVYECNSANIGTLAPGQTHNLNFEVIKTNDAARLLEDDLSLRADVVGEIALSDGTLSWFPTPDVATITNRANNYSLDSVRARVIGFNLTKTQVGTCSENNPPPAIPDNLVQIGEECTVQIDTGGWFGFETPGFTYIAVQTIQVFDELPDGQSYISSTDPALTSSGSITGISLNPGALAPLDEGWFNWTFNQNVPTERITVKDQWFRVNATTRILNKPIDGVDTLPNRQAEQSSNILNSTFDAVFNNAATGLDEIFNLGSGTIGYPTEIVRRVDFFVTEPNITVVKKVCNESLNGFGIGCSNFLTLVNDGDTQDSYIYEVTLSNQATGTNSGTGLTTDRAPAYNLTTTDILDDTDLVSVANFSTDGLDNDADGLIDGLDLDGEGSISENNVAVPLIAPGIVTFSHTHSSGMQRLNAGSNISFYYRVDPHESVSPLQELENTVAVNYDSLDGASGNQTVVLSANSELAGARVYNSADATAIVKILPLQAEPKEILTLSNTAITGTQPQPVSIGEEIEYRLRTLIPVANLKSFSITDNLPVGISCIEAPAINLNAGIYLNAGFDPGGIITPTCNDNLVFWDFGDQELTTATDNNLFVFPVTFIARVNNTINENELDQIVNGLPSTNAFATYRDRNNVQIFKNFSRFDLVVNEPEITLTKTYESNINDAADIITVTVTAENTGSATAYNLKILDDLDAVSNLTYLLGVAGTDPPDTTDTTTLGVNRPIFSWLSANPNYSLAVGDLVSFTFNVQVNDTAQPHEILDNTIQASWTSLPNQNIALNVSGAIGADGSATGMRIGALPNASDTVNDYESTATTSTTVPVLSMNKNDLSAGLATEIGAHKNFEIVINLPEGVTNNLIVNDELDRTGLSYVLSNNADFDITYAFSGISTINNAAPSEAEFTSFPADTTANNAIWNIGTVVTNTEDDTLGVPAINPTITINYFARINNDNNTNTGSDLQNNVTTSYLNGEDASTVNLVDDTPLITATESTLTVTKVATPFTATPITGGDIIEYEVTISNTGNAKAYDINIVDTLPADVQWYSAFLPTALIDTIAVPLFESTPTNNPSGPLIWGRNNTDETLDLDAGSDLVLTYQVQILKTAQANTSFTNSVVVDWTSLNGTSSYERTGTGCPLITLPNDYCAAPATSTVTINDSNTLSKSVVTDSYTPFNDATLRVGDTVTFQLSLNLQEGTTRTVTVEDILPTGMEFVAIDSINRDTTANYTPPTGIGSNFFYSTILATALPVAGQTGTLTFTLGDVVNDPLGDVTTDTLNIIYQARVVENILTHVATTPLTNTATLAYLDGQGTAIIDPARLRSTALTTVVQPIMTVPTKTDRSGRANNSNVSIATDTMNYRLSSCNDFGLAPAYSLQITDSLATQYGETSITGPVNGLGQPDVYINGVLTTPGLDYTYTAPAIRGGNMLFELTTAVDPGQCVVINYDIGFYTDFGANQNWDNTVDVDEYWSLPLKTGQLYSPLGPTTFTLMNNNPYVPPSKVLLSPVNGEVTIGEEIIYQIIIPQSNAARFDVVITDTLDPSLEYLSFTEVSGNGFVLTDNTVAPGNINLTIDFTPAGQDLIIEVHARVANNTFSTAGLSFNNTVTYTHADSPGGAVILAGSGTTVTPVLIKEPLLSFTRAVTNDTNPGNLPVAGDVLRYTLSLTASGGAVGDNFSDAFDIGIFDQLSKGLLYQAGSSTVTGTGNTISDPAQFGDGIFIEQKLGWNDVVGSANIDITEGSSVTITYDVLVLDSALVNQTLSNTSIVKWTGLNGINSLERTGSSSPSYNDYYTAPINTNILVADNNVIIKSRQSDTYNSIDDNVRVGDVVEYKLSIGIQEGLTNNASVTDTLPKGLSFENIVSVNSQTNSPYNSISPFIHSDISVVSAGDPRAGPSTITFTIGDIKNISDASNTNDEIIIIYTARVLENVHTQTSSITLTNNVQLDYTTATGVANKATSSDIFLLQPVLTVSKSAVAVGGNTILDANEMVTYTVDVTNNGNAPAYDLVLEDIIPLGMRNGTATITPLSITLVTAGSSLGNIIPTYDVNTGLSIWNFDNGTANSYTIPATETLRIVYQVQTDANIGAGVTLTNQAVAQLYYSFDDEAVPLLNSVTGVRETYGPSNTAIFTLTTPAPGALLKENPTDLTVSIGETFTYKITIPATPINTTLHDVRILDNLIATADLNFVSVTEESGLVSWSPVNTGTLTNVVIEDITTGIDIPAGEQVVLNLTVQVANTLGNVSGLLFNNTATYTYNQVDNDLTTQQIGAGFTTPNMTIVGPDTLTLEKSGPALMRIGTPDIFTLNIQNTGTAPAWDLTVTDALPNFDPLAGGMCNVSPDTVIAQIFLADGTTPVSAVLIKDTDYIVNFTPAPTCEFSITMTSPNAVLAETNRLIISYQASLDTDTPSTSNLINIAGVTQWFSQDTNGAGATDETRTYTRTLSTGTTTFLDHEDAHDVALETPIVLVQKRVTNVTTGQDPGSNAQPGDTLRYSIFIQNQSPLVINDFTFFDDLDSLNTTAAFLSGTLNLISAPVGSNITNINTNGGSKGTGIVDIRNIFLDAMGNQNDTVNIEFEIELAPVITNGTVVLNQGFAQNIEINLATDDPNIAGVDDPLIIGDENATETLINSAAQFQVLKVSQDMTDDPAILVSGDTLQYTITVKNIGNEDAINTIITDTLPDNTTYVANSTTLNGSPVVDAVVDELPLITGISINAAENSTSGYMRGDATTAVGNIATITFDVLIDPNLINGTIISNQAFVNAEGAGSPAISEQASDDPATLAVDDPTRDVIGNQPLLDVLKTVSIEVDGSTPDILDPNDIIRYTITVSNIGATEATEVSLMDLIPADTAYIPNSVTLNGEPVGIPDGGTSPLIASIAISSSDLTLASPLPTTGNGIITAGESAVITFDARVDGAAAVGTVISNQATVESLELPTELSDADGNDLNGDQPTLIVVGNAQLVSITKSVSVVGGGPALAGGQLEYRIRVTNIGLVPVMTILITDDLKLPIPNQMTYVNGSGLLDGLSTGISITTEVLEADFGTNYGSLEPTESTELTFLVTLDASLPIGTSVNNIAQVYWNSALQNDSANVSIDIGGTPGVGNISGTLWHDANFDNVIDSSEQFLSGWSIDVYRSGVLLGTQTSDIDGLYNVNGLIPNNIGTDKYELIFRAPGSSSTTALIGIADSPPAYAFTNESQSIKDIVISSGGNLINLNLPVDPNGVVYDSILRTPISGATISLLNASTGTEVSSACFDDTAQQNQITINNGYYKFDLNFTQVDCIAGSNYLIRITPPATGFNLNPSLVITPQTDATTAALNVPFCPLTAADAITTTATVCEAQTSEFAPAVSVVAGSSATNYYLHLRLDGTVIPDDSQLFNNHLPIDPILTSAVTISKTTPLVNVVRSQLVPYTITVTNTLPVELENSNIIDSYPAGFKYVTGSARFNDVAMEPVNNNLTLEWNNIDLPINDTHTIKLLLIAGAAVNEGEYVNKAQVFDTLTNGAASEIAEATVRVIPDPAFDCSDVIGKIYDDKNLNTYQDKDENGLADVRVVTARGLQATTDKFGRFHITCAVVPDGSRGSNFIMKVDERSLPTGYRMTTENPRVQRATRGKMLKFNFGATIHKVVSMDLANDVFVTNSDHVHALWQPRLDLLIEHLKKAPSVLRLSYLADTENVGLVNDRLEKIKEQIIKKWEPLGKYRLVIETEIFWRRGSPSKRGGFN